MEINSEGSGAADGDHSTEFSGMLSSPSAGGMRIAGSYAQRGSPGVRRAVSKPIQIIRSSSVPTQLQERSQPSTSQPGAGSGGNSRRMFHRQLDRGLQHDQLHGGGAGGVGVMVQSLPIPPAPLLAGSLPPSRFDDVPPLSLGPQANNGTFSPDFGSLSASLKSSRRVEYATSCPATLGGNFGRPPGPKLNSSMSVLEEGVLGDEEENDDAAQGPRSMTALSILESLAKQVPSASFNGASEPDESVESLADRSERLTIQDDVFELEGLDEVTEDLEALSMTGNTRNNAGSLTKLSSPA